MSTIKTIKTSHTPGPWFVLDARPEGVEALAIARLDNPPIICRIESKISGVKLTQEDQANAALIAAAPDLLKACRHALAALTDPDTDEQDAIDALESTIGKATEGVTVEITDHDNEERT
jgi:hypothetical protein